MCLSGARLFRDESYMYVYKEEATALLSVLETSQDAQVYRQLQLEGAGNAIGGRTLLPESSPSPPIASTQNGQPELNR